MKYIIFPVLLASTLMASEAYNPSTGFIDQSAIVVSSTHLAGFATSPAIGAIRFGSQTNTASFTYANTAPENYGVNNDGKGNLSGYAWNPTVGWIQFAPENSGVIIDPQTGAFSGYAFNENIGWIAFAGTASDGTNYGVVSDWKADNPVAINDHGKRTDSKSPFTGITLLQNPISSDRAEILVSIGTSAVIRLAIFDAQGNKLDEQTSTTVTSGKPYRFIWDLRDRSGKSVASGNYIAVAVVKDASGAVKQFRTMIGVMR